MSTSKRRRAGSAYWRMSPRRLTDGRIATHLLSDEPGEAGGIELIAVAMVVGCNPFAVQHAGTYKEHFDLIGERRIAAAHAHPHVRQVRWRMIAAILRAKRLVGRAGRPIVATGSQ